MLNRVFSINIYMYIYITGFKIKNVIRKKKRRAIKSPYVCLVQLPIYVIATFYNSLLGIFIIFVSSLTIAYVPPTSFYLNLLIINRKIYNIKLIKISFNTQQTVNQKKKQTLFNSVKTCNSPCL